MVYARDRLAHSYGTQLFLLVYHFEETTRSAPKGAGPPMDRSRVVG